MAFGALSALRVDHPTGCTGEFRLDFRFRRRLHHRRECKWGIPDEDDTLKKYFFEGATNSALRAMTATYAKKGIEDEDSLKKMISEMLAPMTANEGKELGFETGEIWSVAVYIFSEETSLLEPIWTYKSRNHPSRGQSRSWPEGAGHVGLAFQRKCAIATANARHGEAAVIFGA